MDIDLKTGLFSFYINKILVLDIKYDFSEC